MFAKSQRARQLSVDDAAVADVLTFHFPLWLRTAEIWAPLALDHPGDSVADRLSRPSASAREARLHDVAASLAVQLAGVGLDGISARTWIMDSGQPDRVSSICAMTSST
jgi:hypothetical protein